MRSVERYSKPQDLSYNPTEGKWIDVSQGTVLTTEEVLPRLLNGSLVVSDGQVHIHPLEYRNYFGSIQSTTQSGKHAYHIVILLPDEVKEMFRGVYMKNMRGEDVSLAEDDLLAAEHIGMIIPASLRSELLRYTIIYGDTEDGITEQLQEIHMGDRAQELMHNGDSEGRAPKFFRL